MREFLIQLIAMLGILGLGYLVIHLVYMFINANK